MGIPSFFKWLRDKYPLALHKKHHDIKPGDCDNLYIDMNGLIHLACHTTEGNQYGVAEDEMISRVLAYIEHIFALIQPCKLLYLAIDGVAPRAKLNQQRARRYEAARHRRSILESDDSMSEDDENTVAERMEAIKESLDLGIFDAIPEADIDDLSSYHRSDNIFQSFSDQPKCPSQPPEIAVEDAAIATSTEQLLGWDSNCITPGTPFMVRLAACLRSFICAKQNTDLAWRQVAVLLSDSNTCGEGEHKIISFIRGQRCKPSYNPNTRHLICGSDADFIMLALALHEPHCEILRERRMAGFSTDPTKLTFDVLSIGILREYLILEFTCKLKKDTADEEVEVDAERLIDDFVFLCFFVGNDFLPHLPSCFVDVFAIDNLLEIYRKALPSLGGYLTSETGLDYRRIGKLVSKFAALEDTQFSREAKAQQSFGVLKDATKWRDAYYESIGICTDDEKRSMCKEYVCGWSWVSLYYSSNTYRSHPDAPPRRVHRKETASQWKWFYPFHYAPFARDIAEFLLSADDKTLGELSAYQRYSTKPFTPFCQLLAVLPPDSMGFLPEAYQRLVEDEDSLIADFYPKHYLLDPNGRAQDWKAVVLLPFVDEKRLLEATSELDEMLSPEEQKRNELRHTALLCVHSSHPVAIHAQASYSDDGFWDIDPSPGLLQGYIKLSEMDTIVGDSQTRFIKDIPNAEQNNVICYTFLDPEIPCKAPLQRLLPGAVMGPSALVTNRALTASIGTITGFGQSYCSYILLIYSVAVACEVLRSVERTNFEDGAGWLLHATSLAIFHCAAGLLATPQQSLTAVAGQKEKSRNSDRDRRRKFLQDCPPGAYQDWVCEECLVVNFQKIDHCHICGTEKGPAVVTMFTHKQVPFETSKIVIDHRMGLIKVRGWPKNMPYRIHR